MKNKEKSKNRNRIVIILMVIVLGLGVAWLFLQPKRQQVLVLPQNETVEFFPQETSLLPVSGNIPARAVSVLEAQYQPKNDQAVRKTLFLPPQVKKNSEEPELVSKGIRQDSESFSNSGKVNSNPQESSVVEPISSASNVSAPENTNKNQPPARAVIQESSFEEPSREPSREEIREMNSRGIIIY